MRRIINGKRYDTETATMVADVGSSGYISRTDFRYDNSKLYRTAKGRWFIAGSGGPMSRWAQSVGNGRTSGSGILPIGESDAREMLENRGETEALETYFAKAIEDA